MDKEHESVVRQQSTATGEFDARFYEKSLSSVGTLWTVNDQKRLLALHGLHHRMLEYHNNIHMKETKIDLPRKDSITDPNAEEEEDEEVFKDQLMVAEAIYFHNYLTGDIPTSGNAANNYRVHTLTYADLDKFCQKINPIVSVNRRASINKGNSRPLDAAAAAAAATTTAEGTNNTSSTSSAKKEEKEETNGFTWIHLRDLIGLDTLARAFNIHDLICQGFRDLRSHSSILPCDGEALVTLVACNLEGFDFNMYKLYIYVSKNLVVTFQAEILPDINQQEIASADKLVLPIIENQMKIRKKCVKLGPAYLLYELAQQVLKTWDNSLEFCSYSVSYFNRIVHLNLLHRERLEIMIKMNMISAGVMLFRNSIEEANSICGILVSALLDGGDESHRRSSSAAILASRANGIRPSMNSIVNNDIENGKMHVSGSGIRRFLVPDVLQDHLHTPYFIDLADAFLFTNSCLQNLFEEIVRCEGELDATIQLRSNNTSIVLSLVATVFLPLTFFAGVFGMNFQEDGGYSIGLLNEKHGPTAFYMLCMGKYTKIYFYVCKVC